LSRIIFFKLTAISFEVLHMDTGFPNKLTCKSKREKAGGTTTNTLARLHWGSRMEPLRASTKWNVGGGGGPWCVAG